MYHSWNLSQDTTISPVLLVAIPPFPFVVFDLNLRNCNHHPNCSLLVALGDLLASVTVLRNWYFLQWLRILVVGFSIVLHSLDMIPSCDFKFWGLRDMVLDTIFTRNCLKLKREEKIWNYWNNIRSRVHLCSLNNSKYVS